MRLSEFTRSLRTLWSNKRIRFLLIAYALLVIPAEILLRGLYVLALVILAKPSIDEPSVVQPSILSTIIGSAPLYIVLLLPLLGLTVGVWFLSGRRGRIAAAAFVVGYLVLILEAILLDQSTAAFLCPPLDALLR